MVQEFTPLTVIYNMLSKDPPQSCCPFSNFTESKRQIVNSLCSAFSLSDGNKSQRWRCFSWPAQFAEIPLQRQSGNMRECFISWVAQTGFVAEERGCWVESPKGSSIVGGDNCTDSEHFDPLSSQMLNRLRFITLFTLKRSALYCFSVCIQMPSKEGIWLLNATRRFELVPAKWHVLSHYHRFLSFLLLTTIDWSMIGWRRTNTLLKHNTG